MILKHRYRGYRSGKARLASTIIGIIVTLIGVEGYAQSNFYCKNDSCYFIGRDGTDTTVVYVGNTLRVKFIRGLSNSSEIIFPGDVTFQGTVSGVTSESGGDITAVNANSPITGGGTTGAVSVGVDTTDLVSTKYNVDSKISTHASNASAHHTKTTSGDDITSGTIADSRIASTIARDSEVTTQLTDSLNAVRKKQKLYGHFILFDADGFAKTDTAWAAPNREGTTINITEIWAESTVDDDSVIVVSRDQDGGNVSVIDTVLCATDGSNVYYGQNTSGFDDGTIGSNQKIGIVVIGTGNINTSIWRNPND